MQDGRISKQTFLFTVFLLVLCDIRYRNSCASSWISQFQNQPLVTHEQNKPLLNLLSRKTNRTVSEKIHKSLFEDLNLRTQAYHFKRIFAQWKASDK